MNCCKLVALRPRLLLPNGQRNVQRVMEAMGGGGHLSNAATQLADTTTDEVNDQLLKILAEDVEE